MRFINLCFPIWCLTIPSPAVFFNFQFPSQSIRNMNLVLLDKIHDIHIVDMQKQGDDI